MSNKLKAVDVEALASKFSHVPSRTWKEFACGWGAAFINVVITFPINKVMFRQMLHGLETHKAFGQLKLEGLGYLYRGILPPLIQKTFSVSLMFGVFEKSQQVLNGSVPSLHPTVAMTASAMLAGTVEAALTPLERIQTVLQDNHNNMRYRNSLHIASSLRKFGFREYYRGLVPILVRNGPSNVMFFGLRKEVRLLLPETEMAIGQVVADFISGAVVGAIISTAFYPVNVVKTRMQAQVGGEFPSFLKVFRLIYEERERSVRRLFYGVHLNYTRAILSWGIINASYELLKKLIPDNPAL